jgi:hypothetical protein
MLLFDGTLPELLLKLLAVDLTGPRLKFFPDTLTGLLLKLRAGDLTGLRLTFFLDTLTGLLLIVFRDDALGELLLRWDLIGLLLTLLRGRVITGLLLTFLPLLPLTGLLLMLLLRLLPITLTGLVLKFLLGGRGRLLLRLGLLLNLLFGVMLRLFDDVDRSESRIEHLQLKIAQNKLYYGI